MALENIDATSKRISVLSEQLEKLNSQYAEGAISLEDYEKKTAELNTRMDNLNKGMKESQHLIDANAKKANDYSSSFEKIGATANTAFGILAAGLSKTNPELAHTVGSVQKMIPNLVELGNAAKKTGSLFKAMTSGAGILTLVTLVTTLVTDFDNIASSLGLSDDTIKKIKEGFSKVLSVVTGVGNAIVKWITNPLKTIVSAFKKVIKGDFKGALEDIKEGIKTQFSRETYTTAYEAGKEWGKNLGKGVKKSSPDVKNAVEGLASEVGQKFIDSLKTMEFSASDYQEMLDNFFPEDALTRKMLEYSDKAKSILSKYLGQEGTEGDEDIEEDNSIFDQFIDNEKFDNACAQAKGAYIEMAQGIIAASTQIVGAFDDILETQRQNGKLSDKEYEKRKKAIKAFQIACIVANSASAIFDIWKGYTAELAGNAETAAAAGPGFAVLKAALDAKSLGFAIANTTVIGATAAAQIAAVASGSKGSTASTPSVNVSPTAPTYQLNPNSVEEISAGVGESTSETFNSIQTVLVVEDVNQVQDNMRRTKTAAEL